jgi:quercetin dioxygenase-like cupin family protein
MAEIQISHPAEGQSYPELGRLTCKIASTTTNNAFTVLELILAPGQGAGLHLHQHEDEMVVVQSGVCTVGNEEQSWLAEEGSVVVFPKQTTHFFRNDSPADCTLLITAVPGGLDHYFSAIAEAVKQPNPAEAVAAVNEQYGLTFFN